MLIKTLVENTSISKDFGSEHGLSLYIETKKHKILFDVGASELFLKNAKKLDVSIADVDFLVISHGHYDHGGGLKSFLHENTKVEVFLHRLAFENERNVEVVVGASGDAKASVENYLRVSLKQQVPSAMNIRTMTSARSKTLQLSLIYYCIFSFKRL